MTRADFTGSDLADAILRDVTGLSLAKGLDRAENLDKTVR